MSSDPSMSSMNAEAAAMAEPEHPHRHSTIVFEDQSQVIGVVKVTQSSWNIRNSWKIFDPPSFVLVNTRCSSDVAEFRNTAAADGGNC
jgi:hypothetical protein